MTKLTEHFSLSEFEVSEYACRKGLDNSIPKSLLPNIQKVADLMEKVRLILGEKRIIVNSAYRSPEINAAVGGVVTSEHCQALACDFICPTFGDPYQIAKKLSLDKALEYGQLIYEGTWVHISVYGRHKKQNLTMQKGKYYNGINKG